MHILRRRANISKHACVCKCCCGGLRTDTKKKITGRWSRMLRDFLLDLLYSPTDGLATVGCAFRIAGKDILLFAKLHIFLPDGEGMAESLQWRGANAIKCCIKCDNILSIGSDLANRVGSHFVEASCDDPRQFRPTTAATLKKNVDMIFAGRRRWGAGLMTRGALDDLEKCTGLSMTVHGALASADLLKDLVPALSYDWVHNMLAGGTLVVEINGLVKLRHPGMSWSALQDAFSKDWCLPSFQNHRTQLWQVFKASAVSGQLKSSCSELLGIYAILRHVVTNLVKSLPSDNVASFLACCNIVDIILKVKASRREGEAKRMASHLRRSISTHLSLHKRAYGEALLLPKHHWNFHVADQWERDGVVVDLFVTERLHLELKRTAEKLKLAEDKYADTLLTMRCVTHCAEMQTAHRQVDRLLGSSTALPSTGLAMTTARSMDVNGVKVSVGDVVISRVDQKVGVVAACICTMAGDLYCSVTEYEQTSRLSSHSTVWKATALERSWLAAPLELAKAWYRDPADRLVVLV